MVETRSYLTGGLGSRDRDEAFGDPFELPPDRAYSETCAAIASVMLAWRLLLATGDPDCADVIERTAFNGVLPGLSLEGTSFFYVNTLQRRTDRVDEDDRSGSRKPWFACACCPPNVMRFLASWPQLLATGDETGVQVHQLATAEIETHVAGEAVRIETATSYPWEGGVTVTVAETPATPWTLSLRVPAWCRSASVRDRSGELVELRPGDRQFELTRSWQPGETVQLDLDLSVRTTEPDRRVDAVRGCVALERGPLVYCVETADLPADVQLEDVELDPAVASAEVPRPDVAAQVVGLDATAVTPAGSPVRVGAVPYFTWANRTADAMRVWIPRAPTPAGDQ
jgi:DUF1680 family protein